MDTRRSPALPPGRPRVIDHVTRVGCSLGLPAVLSELGVDPRALLREVGLPAETFDAAENVVPYASLCRYVDLATQRTGVSDLGLRACVNTGLRSLVTVGYLVAHSQNVAVALQTLEQYLHLHDEGGASYLVEMGADVALGYEVLIPPTAGCDQVVFGSIAIAANIMRELCGSHFRLRRVTFAYPSPADTTLFRAFFRAPVTFASERSAIVFDAKWLAAPVDRADAFIRKVLEEKVQLDGGAARHTDEDRIRRVVRTLVATGRWSGDEVAACFGMSRRTLARRLRENGSSLRDLVAEALVEAAQHLLQSTALSMHEIAARLGYADAASFSRAFKRWTGLTPTAWIQLRARLGSPQ